MYLNWGYQDMEYDEYEIVHAGDPSLNLPGVPFTGDDETLDIADDAIFAYRPENTLAAGIEYVMPVGDGMELSFRIDGRYVDELTWHATPDFLTNSAGLLEAATPFSDCGRFVNGSSAACIEEDGYALVDVRVQLSEIQVGDRMTARVAAWGRNIFDEEYIVSGIDFGAIGFGGAVFGKPATWGIDITFEY